MKKSILILALIISLFLASCSVKHTCKEFIIENKTDSPLFVKYQTESDTGEIVLSPMKYENIDWITICYLEYYDEKELATLTNDDLKTTINLLKIGKIIDNDTIYYEIDYFDTNNWEHSSSFDDQWEVYLYNLIIK